MAETVVVESKPAFLVGRGSIFTAFGVGAAVGFFGWLLMLAFNHWMLIPVFCRSSDTTVACANSALTAWIIGHVVMAVISLFILIRANVFRPLLVVLAAIVTLWVIGLWFVPMVWWIGLLWQTALFALAYALYAWLASHERFVLSIVLIVIAVFVMRLLIAL